MLPPSRAARYYYLRFLRLKGDPHNLARGVAIGLFIGVTPTIPLHTVLILFISYILRGNIIAGLLASMLISNPLTFLPQYYFSWKIGKWLTTTELSWNKIKEVVVFITSDASLQESISVIGQLSLEAIITLLIGGCLLAVPVGMAGYFFSLNFFRTIRRKRREKHILK